MEKMIKNFPLVSVLILTYNRTDLLKQALDAALKSDYPNLEFIISDNASTDDIAGFIRKDYPKKEIKVFKKKINGGLTGGFNFGFKFCKGKYVQLLCNDTKITKSSISQMVKMMEEDEKIGAIAPKVTQMRNPEYIHSAGSFLTYTGLLYHYGVYQKDSKLYDKPYYTFSTTGAGFLVRKETIEKSGLYDEDFFMAYDESDLCHRIWLSGYTIVYCPKAEIKHFWAATQDPGNPIVWYWNQRNVISSIIYNYSFLNMLKFLFTVNIAFLALFFIQFFKGNFSHALTLPKAYLWHLKHIRYTFKKRKIIQETIRKVSDKQIFQKAMVNPSLRYYLIHFKKKFTERDLPKRVIYGFSEKNYIISFHEAIPVGPAYDLRKFLFLQGSKKLLFISHPLLYNKEVHKNSSWYEYYEDGNLRKKDGALHWKLPEAFLYIKDFLYTLFWSRQLFGKCNIFVGLDPLNALAGLLFKMFGKVEKVIYYSIDYFPIRFKNKLLNSLYHLIDRICVKFCDETWNVSPNMAKSRGYEDRQYTVPIGIWFNRTKRLPFSQINKKKLVFIGLVDITSGVELAIRAVPKILVKVPGVKLEIVGSGPEEENLKKLAKELNIENHVKFYGWVIDRVKVEKILSDGAVGLVLFNTKIFKEEVKNADPMKLKDYMVFGMPIISTDAISTKDGIRKARAGIIIKYDIEEFTNAVIKLLMEQSLLNQYRENALDYVKKFDIENIYRENIKRIIDL